MKKCIIFLIIISSLHSWGQITFEKRYDFPQVLYFYSVLQEQDSGFIITGNGFSSLYSGYDGCLLRTNKFGDLIWLKPTGFVEDDHSYDVIKTNDNGYAFTGDIQIGYGDEDLILVKTDNNGNMEWSANFGGVNWEKGYSLIQTNTNGFIIAGYSNSINGPGPQPYDFYVIKTNSNGNLQWEKKIGGDENEFAYSVCPANNNSFIVAGSTESYGAGDNIYLLKLDNNGNIVWSKTYENGTTAKCIQPTFDGNYIVLAAYRPFAKASQILAMKINENGDSLWSKSYSGNESRYASYCTPSNDGGFVITGYIDTNTSTGVDIILIKTNNNGDILWTKTYGNIANEYGSCVKQTNDGGYIITGDGSFNSVNQFTYLVKTDSFGCIKPIIDSIVGHINVSIYDTITYQCIDIRGEEYNWISGFGEIVYGQGNDTIAITWSQLGTDTIQVYVSNGCGIDSMDLVINIDTCVSPLLSPIYGNTEVTLFDIEEYYVNLLEGKHPLNYLWNVVCGSILSGQNTPSILVEWDLEGFGSIEVIASNECGIHSQIIEDILIIYPGVQEQNHLIYSLYPNPSQGKIYVRFPKNIENADLEVFDINGRSLFQRSVTNNNNQINMAVLQKGLYFIKIKTNNKIKVEKIIIN